jgi:hypothetical protein
MPRSSLDHFSMSCNGSKGVAFLYSSQGGKGGREVIRASVRSRAQLFLKALCCALHSDPRTIEDASARLTTACLTVCREGCDDAERIAIVNAPRLPTFETSFGAQSSALSQ